MNKTERAELLKDMIQDAIEDGADSVEKVHQHIASLPFDALERLGLFEEQQASSLKQKHHRTVGLVYDAIRKVNHEVGSLISEQFAALEDARAAKENISKKDQSIEE